MAAVYALEMDCIKEVGELLRDPGFLELLDKPTATRPRVRFLLQAIAKHGTREAERAIVALSVDRNFTSNHARVEALINATGWFREPSPELLAFLDSQLSMDKRHVAEAVKALVRMRSPAACELLAAKVRRPEFKGTCGWFCSALRSVRFDPVIVRFCKELLESAGPDQEYRFAIIATLFQDYQRPDSRTGVSHMPVADLQSVTDEVLRDLLAVADLALKESLGEQLKANVTASREVLTDLLRRRSLGTRERLADLIGQLNDDSFTVREKAAEQLREIGDVAEIALRSALLAEKTPAETKKRAEALLQEICKPKSSK
jgi:hypothetical protein